MGPLFSLSAQVKIWYPCAYVANSVLLLQLLNVCVTEGNTKMSAGDVLEQFRVQLYQHLPLDDMVFFARARRASLLPLDTADVIQAIPTRTKKVDYFLQHIIEPGAEEYLPKLLQVMKESNIANVVRLADDIRATITIDTQVSTRIGMYVYTYIAKSFTIA